MHLVRLAFAFALVILAACGEVAAPAIDAPIAVDAAIDAAVDADGTATLVVSKTGTGTGTVASAPAGISCGSTCSGEFALGASVTLTATPDVGSAVSTWGGACASATGNTCTLTVNADAAVTVAFAPAQHTVTVTSGGGGLGRVTSTPAGIDCGASGTTCTASFAYGTAVTLTPTPSPGSLFGGWSGGTCAGLGACAFTVMNDATVNADFQLDNFTLVVSKVGNGTGTVASSPAGISCGATCAMSFPFGTMVTLTAAASPDSVFNGWTGACTGTSTCVVTMSASRMVTAAFTLRQFGLTVSTSGTGSGTVTSVPAGINCGTDCTEFYDSGTTVTLTATPAANSTFAGWGGACTGTGSCTVTIAAATTVTAAFPLQRFTLTVTRAGTGSGTVTSSPAGINCGATCSASYDAGTSVTLNAVAGTGATFAGWSGACTGAGTCTVSMTAARAVTATFNSLLVSVTVSKSGVNAGGAVITSSPAGITCGATCVGSFAVGTVVTLTQVPGGGIFNGWGGPCTGTGTCTFTVGGATTVTAPYRAVRVALNASPTSCLRGPTNVLARATTVLQARGHTVTLVTAAELDTIAEINAFDVLVPQGPGAGCSAMDVAAFDSVVDQFVRTAGGGVVATGWFLFSNLSAPALVGVLPSDQVGNYFSGNQTVTVVPGHPITAGLAGFNTNQWLPWGGGPRPATTSLLSVGSTIVAEAWSVGAGRTVFAGPMFLEDYNAYESESLLDGSQAAPLEFFLRAVEWAGKAR